MRYNYDVCQNYETLLCFADLSANQPAVLLSHIESAPATNHQPVSSIFFSQQISTSHQPQPAEQPLASKTRAQPPLILSNSYF